MDEEVILGPLFKKPLRAEVGPRVDLDCRRAAWECAATKQGGPS